MATQQAALPVNGNYASHDGYANATTNDLGASQLATSSSAANAEPNQTGSGTGAANNSHTDVPKDEVGWYFVEQYYTNLSRSPEKLHLFYTKRSQFVSGVEAEKVPVAVGRTAIAENIKKLGFQDCKVRVCNVDSQSSFNNIVIQVIGEISNRSAPHRKFAQTFVLAEQPNGYFVLNDIFRYINFDDGAELEPEQEAEPEASPEKEAEQATVTTEADDQQRTAVEQGTESGAAPPDDQAQNSAGAAAPPSQQPTAVPAVPAVPKLDDAPANNHVSDHGKVDEPAPAMPDSSNDSNKEELQVQETTPRAPPSPSAAEDKNTESSDVTDKPTEGIDTTTEERRDAPAKESGQPPATPAQPPMPEPISQSAAPAPTPKASVPKTWANLVAGPAATSAGVATPSAVPSTSPVPVRPRAPPSPQSTDANEAQQLSPPTSLQGGPNSGWQTAGTDHAKRQNRPQSISGPGDRGDKVLAYVKNVSDKVSTESLRNELLKYGELAYFDISRQKNCAFVEFSTPAGYNAAVAANPHLIDGEQVLVEERRPRSNAYGGSSYYANRGGQGRGRGGGSGGPDGRMAHQGRGGFQKDGSRGGYGPSRGGRGGMAPVRGRGGSQNA